MALNIKDPATDALARRVAELSGESITRTVHSALETRLAELLRNVAHVGGSVDVREVGSPRVDQLHVPTPQAAEVGGEILERTEEAVVLDDRPARLAVA